MEVVGAAASTVTLLGLAVKGTEALYNTISGFKNVSSRTEALSSAINNLRALLTQLKNNKALPEDTPALKDFKKLLRSYDVDIKRHEKDLQRMQSFPQDSKTKQFSKKLKGAISGDKDLLRILAELTQCCTVLGTQLNILLYDTTLTIRNNVLDLRVASSTRAVHDVNQSKQMLEQSTNVSAMNGKIENVQTSVDGIHEAVMTMTKRMERIPQVSDAQNNDIRNLLLALQDQISGLSNNSTGSRSNPQSTSTHDLDDEERGSKESELKASIERLQNLASEKEGSVHGEEAECLVTDLECILKAVSVPQDNSHITPSEWKFGTFSTREDISACEMKRLCGIVASSHSIDLNSGHPRSKPPTRGKVSKKHKIKEVAAREYSLSVELTQRTFSDPHEGQNQLTSPFSMIETMARVKIVEQSESPSVLVAYLSHIQVHNGFASLNPVISIGKMLPNDSPLFGIVKGGNVDELKRLLRERECTLRDRDSYGTPLLHYALTQPSMCKFLIEHGADVDEMATSTVYRDNQNPPLIEQFWQNYYEEDQQQTMIECTRLLLQAGADPTVRDSRNIHALDDTSRFGTSGFLKTILDYGGPWIDLENRNLNGQTGLIRSVSKSMEYSDGQSVKLLLDRGANIHARDYEGLTCLHTAIHWAHSPCTLEQDIKVLIVFIERGADIFTTDNIGHSIFDDAYTCNHHEFFPISPIGGYQGDLWDAALSRCGYGKHIRSSRTRICHFTERYTKDHFARLWKGREDECPYFSDTPVLCPRYIQELCCNESNGELSDSEFADDEYEQDQEEEQEEEERRRRRRRMKRVRPERNSQMSYIIPISN